MLTDPRRADKHSRLNIQERPQLPPEVIGANVSVDLSVSRSARLTQPTQPKLRKLAERASTPRRQVSPKQMAAHLRETAVAEVP